MLVILICIRAKGIVTHNMARTRAELTIKQTRQSDLGRKKGHIKGKNNFNVKKGAYETFTEVTKVLKNLLRK